MRARICSAFSCDMFARVVWLKPWGAAKPPTFALPFTARTRHARLARLTRARRGGSEGGRRESSLLTFAALFVSEKREKKKKFLYFKDNTSSVSLWLTPSPTGEGFHPLFLLHIQAQKKKLSKRKRRWGDFALCGARQGRLALDPAAF